MGALHEGHLSLVRRAAELADDVVVTIFVNPTQFGPNEDLAKYPRTLERDVEGAMRAGATCIFAPPIEEMYPPGERTRVSVSGLTDHLCGASRPGHFTGVATIVTKIFALVGASTAVFGRKDYQQVKVIERMTRDLMLPVRVVAEPTVRESDGLALSSRNRYLSDNWRGRALSIVRALDEAARLHARGERSAGVFRQRVREKLEAAGLRVDYVELADPDELDPIADGEQVGERVLLAIAAFADSTRLIDNLVLGEDLAPLSRGDE